MPSERRVRNWSFLVYEDSAPKDWVEQLNELNIAWAMSPRHDKDVMADGTPKKPHWHVLICYDGPTSYSIAEEVAKKCGASIVKRVESVNGLIRYFTHIDDPQKYQYDRSEIVARMVDVEAPYMDSDEEERVMDRIIDIIDRTRIANMLELNKYFNHTGDREAKNFVNKSHAYIVQKYLDAMYQKNRAQELPPYVTFEMGLEIERSGCLEYNKSNEATLRSDLGDKKE